MVCNGVCKNNLENSKYQMNHIQNGTNFDNLQNEHIPNENSSNHKIESENLMINGKNVAEVSFKSIH